MTDLNPSPLAFARHPAINAFQIKPIASRTGLDVALIGNSLPRLCGISTFTTDLQQALSQSPRIGKTSIVAMTDHGQHYAYPPSVAFSIPDQEPRAYAAAARFLNVGAADVVCLQHEFGIFGGPDGDHILLLVEALEPPLVTTFHTILDAPTRGQRRVVRQIARASSGIVVMADKAAQLLTEHYDVDSSKVAVIPHGIPDVRMAPSDVLKNRMGFARRTVILTFGLLSPNKGIEVMLDAMPTVLRTCPDALYIVLGATHPQLLGTDGDRYRDSLTRQVQALGLQDNVMFINAFVERSELLDYIAMCDVYVTPYLSEAQMTSGTLAYSFGLGRPIVSTPYWHAAELLAGGRGVLVPFADPLATGRAIAQLLGAPHRRKSIGARNLAEGRAMTWPRVAERYVDAFVNAVACSGHAVAPEARRLTAA